MSRYEVRRPKVKAKGAIWGVRDSVADTAVYTALTQTDAHVFTDVMNLAHDRSGAAELREALEMFFKFFDCSGAAISARWNKVPHADRVAIVKRARQALKAKPEESG